MDRIQDSGSYDMGSIPVGTTPNASAWVFRVLAFFFADPADGSNPAMTLYNKNSNNFRFIHTEIGKNRCSEREKTGFGLNGTKKDADKSLIPYSRPSTALKRR